MRQLSIRTRIVIAMVLVGVVTFGIVLLVLVSDHRTQVDRVAWRALRDARAAFLSLERRDALMLASVLDTIASRPDVRAALARGDARRLRELTSPLFERLKSRYGVTHLYFIAPDGTVLLRVHRPDQSGDRLTRATFLKARDSGGYGSGLELGLTAYALRVVRSVTASTGVTSAESKRIGYVEAAEETDHFLHSLKAQTGEEYGLLLDKRMLDRGQWAAVRSLHGLRDNWNDRPGYVIAGTTHPSVAAHLGFNGAPDSLPREGTVSAPITRDGRTVVRGLFPITDASGRQTGAIAVLSDLTPEVAQLRSRATRIALVMLATGFLLMTAVLVSLDRLVFSRLLSIDPRGTVSSPNLAPSGSTRHVEPPAARDEIGRFEAELTRSRLDLELQSALLNAGGESFVALDQSGVIVYVNEVALDTRGYSRDEVLGQPISVLVGPSMRSRVPEMLRKIFASGHQRFESEHITKDGRVFPVEVNATVVRSDEGPMIATVMRDLSERKETEATIKRLAYYDPLTGLANRRLFDDRLAMALSHAQRGGTTVAVIFVDVDGLKTINDSLGHAAGDRILKEVARRLSKIARAEDTVARIGGDEFVLLGEMGEDGAHELGQRVSDAIAPPIFVAGRRVAVTASVGIAISSSEDKSPEALVRRADAAMYAVKELGGHGHRVFEEQMRVGADPARFALRNELREAFDRGQLSIHYQPQVRLSDGRITGAEALLRWDHPARGAIQPTEFIAIAEEAGLIGPIGTWVIDTACRQGRLWADAGLPLRVNVNVSPRQFVHANLVSVVESCLRSSGLPPECLELEITESTALSDSPDVQSCLTGLQGLGVRVAVDDFGIGYSSLGLIDRLSVQTLKIDKLFISQITQRSQSRAVVATIVNLADYLGLLAIAEGVETAEQLDVLRELGCAEAQGFLFSAAVAADELESLAQSGADLRPGRQGGGLSA